MAQFTPSMGLFTRFIVRQAKNESLITLESNLSLIVVMYFFFFNKTEITVVIYSKTEIEPENNVSVIG